MAERMPALCRSLTVIRLPWLRKHRGCWVCRGFIQPRPTGHFNNREVTMRFIQLLLSLLLLGSLLGCGKPVPPEKSAYVGEWQEKAMYLVITQDGSVRYKRLQGGASTSIEGPLKGFKGNDFEVGIGPMVTTFVVSKPPFQDGERWKMVVDGVELTKTAD
jgi:hypothetical protein